MVVTRDDSGQVPQMFAEPAFSPFRNPSSGMFSRGVLETFQAPFHGRVPASIHNPPPNCERCYQSGFHRYHHIRGRTRTGKVPQTCRGKAPFLKDAGRGVEPTFSSVVIITCETARKLFCSINRDEFPKATTMTAPVKNDQCPEKYRRTSRTQ